MGNVQSGGASNGKPTQETGILECWNVSTGCCSRGSGFEQVCRELFCTRSREPFMMVFLLLTHTCRGDLCLRTALQSERHVRKGFSHGLFSTSGSDAEPMPQGSILLSALFRFSTNPAAHCVLAAPSPLRGQNGPGISRRGVTRVPESDQPQSTSNEHDSNAVQFATRLCDTPSSQTNCTLCQIII